MNTFFPSTNAIRSGQIFLVLLGFLLVGCGRLPQPTAPPTIQATIRPSATPLPTHTPTITLLPTSTPQPTPIPATATPERPTTTPTAGPAEGVTYHLVEWTAEQANELDTFLQAYPDTTGLNSNPFWGTGEYWGLFRLPALVKLVV